MNGSRNDLLFRKALDDEWFEEYFDRHPTCLSELLETGSVKCVYHGQVVVVSLEVKVV